MSSTIQQYLSSLSGKRVTVLGIGVSNTPLIQMLLNAGVFVVACDKRQRAEFGDQAEELERLGAVLSLGPDYLDGLQGCDVIFRTPGLRPDLPQIIAACARGAILTSEMEVFFEVCPCKIIAVTGSDGKTTTTTIIAELLKAAGCTTYVGGNIGKPLLSDVAYMKNDDIAAIELSSFQLLTMKKSPDVAVVTNLAPNHLDMHKSMEEYVSAKKNIYLHQGNESKAIFNYDNAITHDFALHAAGKSVMFSRKTKLDYGVFLQDHAIWVTNEVGSRMVLPLDDILLPGEHNIENYMAAIASVDGLVPDETIRAFAQKFSGVAHRIELVRTLNGVRYYNDSIASSPSRTIAGLRAFQEKVILIAGGYDKQIPFDSLGVEIVSHVKKLLITGDTALKIRSAVEAAPDFGLGSLEIFACDTLADAVVEAHRMAQPGDVVILSPACASFDHFKNFVERGEAFRQLVQRL